MTCFKSLIKTAALVASIVSLTTLVVGCGSLSHSRDDQALSHVQKVAVVAFMVDEPASATVGFSLTSHKAQAGAGGSLIPQKSDDVNRMLKDLQTSFAKNMNWSVLDSKTMTQNPGYLTAYKNTMEGWQSKTPPNAGRNRFIVEQVMDYDCPRILDRAGRDQLIEALGVDAIVAAKVNVFLTGTSVMGVGGRYPQSNLSFAMYVRGQDRPVWFEGQIKGQVSTASVGSTGFTDEIATSTLAAQSAKTAFQQIGKTAD